jgi:succinyl-CoA synthetase beta subunit
VGRILEYHSKRILSQHGIPTPMNGAAASETEAESIADKIGKKVVLKALVPVGKRGKSGAIQFASTPPEAKEQAKRLLGMTVRQFPVEQVLVEECLDIAEEWFISIALDKQKQLPAIIVTTEGGVEVEDLVKHSPGKIKIVHVDPFAGLEPYQAKEIWSELGLTGKPLVQAASILHKLYQIFIRYECYILEINPLVLTRAGEVVAAASVMGVDDTALFRQPELQGLVEVGSERAWRPLTELEKQMIAVNDADYRGTARYTEMDGGDIGFMCGGGGGSLLCYDALLKLGGAPANYSETGGNPSMEKVYGLAKGILSKPGVKGLFVSHNITNNTQIDVMATGIVKAIGEIGIDPSKFPIVVREAGVNDVEGKAIFEASGITYFGEEITIEQAAAIMIERMKEAGEWLS